MVAVLVGAAAAVQDHAFVHIQFRHLAAVQGQIFLDHIPEHHRIGGFTRTGMEGEDFRRDQLFRWSLTKIQASPAAQLPKSFLQWTVQIFLCHWRRFSRVAGGFHQGMADKTAAQGIGQEDQGLGHAFRKKLVGAGDDQRSGAAGEGRLCPGWPAGKEWPSVPRCRRPGPIPRQKSAARPVKSGSIRALLMVSPGWPTVRMISSTARCSRDDSSPGRIRS